MTEIGGVSHRRGRWFESSIAHPEWDEVMNVNLRSVFFLTQHVVRHMIAARIADRIINIASLLSFQGGIRIAAYTASKHGIAGLSRVLANELTPFDITVNAIAPGYMETDNTAALRADRERSGQILDRIPLGRWGQPVPCLSGKQLSDGRHHPG